MVEFPMIQTHKALLHVSGSSLFLQFLNGRGERLFYFAWKSRGGALIRENTIYIIFIVLVIHSLHNFTQVLQILF